MVFCPSNKNGAYRMLDTLTVAKLKIIAKNQFTTQYDGDCTSTNYPTGFHKMKKAELIKLIRDHREHILSLIHI